MKIILKFKFYLIQFIIYKNNFNILQFVFYNPILYALIQM